MPRFHLSTLLLSCIFAGAMIGVVLNNKVWQLEYTLELDNQEKGQANSSRMLTVDDAGEQMAVLDNYNLYLFDLHKKTLRWKKHIELTSRPIERMRFREFATIIQTGVDEENLNFAAREGALDSSKIAELVWPEFPFEQWQFSDCTRRHCDAYAKNDPNSCMYFDSQYNRIEIHYDRRLEPYEINAIYSAKCVGYFDNDHHLAVGFSDHICVWRRVRNYGWLGLLELPLTWIALLSFATLNLIFLRWIRERIWNRRIVNADVPR